MSSESARPNGPGDPEGTPRAPSEVPRPEDGVYQNNQLVARVLDAQVDAPASEIRFGELYQSDWLLLADECEYQKYRVLIQKVAFATRLDRDSPRQGRVLRGVVAEILGYRGQ